MWRDDVPPNGKRWSAGEKDRVLEMMASCSVLARRQGGEKHEKGKRSVVCSPVLPLITNVMTSAGGSCDSHFRGNPSALHDSHRGLLNFKRNTDSRYSAVRLLTTSRRSALKVKRGSADHTQDHFAHTSNPHIYMNLLGSQKQPTDLSLHLPTGSLLSKQASNIS